MSEWAGRAWPDNINRVMYQTIKTDPSNQIRKLRTQNIKYHKQHHLNVYLRPKYRYSIITSWKNQKRSKYHIKHIHWNAGIAVHFFFVFDTRKIHHFFLFLCLKTAIDAITATKLSLLLLLFVADFLFGSLMFRIFR